MEARVAEHPSFAWDAWVDSCEDAYAKRARQEFAQLIKKTRLHPKEEWRVGKAADFAQRLYDDSDNRNDGTKPIVHILRVANKLLSLGIRDADTIIAALFHDVVEDHPEKLAGLNPRAAGDTHAKAIDWIHDKCDGDVADIVAHTTHRKDDIPRDAPRPLKISKYLEYVRTVADHPQALLIKIADVIDNITFPSPDPRQRDYSMEKYLGSTKILLEELNTHSKELVKLSGGGVAGALFILKIRFELMVAHRKAALSRALMPKFAHA
jgi:(p)ppGpp synthase/HD superfamily hydrolase